MGGRGASSAGGTSARSMNVPYDEWGEQIRKTYRDKDGNLVVIEDEMRTESEEYFEPISKAKILQEVDAWRNDDGTYGDADTAIYFAYSDGTFVDAADLNGKKYKKAGLVGVSFSGADDEMVWGGEINPKTGKLRKWQTWSEDGESGHTDTHVGWKTSTMWMERVKTTFTPNGRKKETIRKSTVKKVTA